MINSENKNSKKILITNKENFKIIKKLMTKESFNEKFEVSMKVVSQILAEDGMVELYFNDSRIATTEEILDLKKKNAL